MSIVLLGSTSGSITLQEPAVAGTTTLTLPATTGTVVVGSSAVSAAGQIPFSTDGSTYTPTAKIVSGTAVTLTTQTSVDYTSIPSWVKRITVMLSGVSTSGTSGIRFRLMVGGVAVTTNYTAGAFAITTTVAASVSTVTDGFPLSIASASSVQQGQIVLCKLSSNAWTATGSFFDSLATERIAVVTGRAFSVGTVDGLRVTTTGGTDTFDAGSINILYE